MVAADAHDHAARYAGFFGQGAVGAVGGVAGEVFFDAGGPGQYGEVLHGGIRGIARRHTEIVFPQYVEGERAEGYFEGVAGFFLNKLEVPADRGEIDEPVFGALPVRPAHTGLRAEQEPVAGDER